MRVIVGKTREQIAALREERILAAWPVPKQLEAHQDAANGDTTKRDRMNADIECIKAALPYPAGA